VEILVTGATGLVGSAAAESLVRAGHRVVALGRRPAPGAAGFVEQDLERPLDTAKLPTRLDAVVHLARSPRIRDFPASAPAIHAIDVRTAVDLASEAAERGARSFVYASSGAALDAGTLPAGSPLAFYAASKRAAEMLLETYGDRLNVATLRLYYPFGPRSPGFVRDLALGVRAGRPVRLGGSDGLTINPIAVEDAGDAVAAALDRPGMHDVAGPEPVTLRQLAGRLGERLGTQPVFEPDPGAPDRVQVGDSRQTAALLGRALTTLDVALDRLVRGLE
jgi:UDP-glucose 4-epimerase